MSVNLLILAPGLVAIIVLNNWDTRKNKPSEKPKDSWEGSSGSLVGQFRAHLESIADGLSCKGDRNVVYARFNLERKCAELYTNDCGVLARICAGETANEVIISSNLSLDELGWFKLLEGKKGPVLKFEHLGS